MKEERQIPYDLSYMWNLKQASPSTHRIDWWVPEVGGGGWAEWIKGVKGTCYQL